MTEIARPTKYNPVPEDVSTERTEMQDALAQLVQYRRDELDKTFRHSVVTEIAKNCNLSYADAVILYECIWLRCRSNA
jgi:hypothetical protein